MIFVSKSPNWANINIYKTKFPESSISIKLKEGKNGKRLLCKM